MKEKGRGSLFCCRDDKLREKCGKGRLREVIKGKGRLILCRDDKLRGKGVKERKG